VTGECLQVFEGHEEEAFSCAFSYDGNAIVSASKDNSLRVWHRRNDTEDAVGSGDEEPVAEQLRLRK
jgi:WD40 repeat protein